jgi:hypothetical protein
MVQNTSFAVAASLLSLVSPAQAQLLSPPLWTDQFAAGTCYVRNIGTTPFTVRVQLFSNNPIGFIDVDTCNTGPLGAGKTCVIFLLNLPADSWAACSAQASNSNVSKLRGSIDIRHFVSKTEGYKVVVREDLR